MDRAALSLRFASPSAGFGLGGSIQAHGSGSTELAEDPPAVSNVPAGDVQCPDEDFWSFYTLTAGLLPSSAFLSHLQSLLPLHRQLVEGSQVLTGTWTAV